MTETLNGIHAEDVDPKELVSYAPSVKSGPFDEQEKDYLRTHWLSSGRNAKSKQDEISITLRRTLSECRAEYRALTGNRISKAREEKKRRLVESRSTEDYRDERQVRDLFDRLSPAVKGILGYMADMGEPDEISISKKAGTLLVQFERPAPEK